MVILNVDQGSDEWRQERLCKISGTRLGDAIGTSVKQETLINELVAEFLTDEPKEVIASKAMQLGTEAEEYAVHEYEIITGELTEKVGICVSKYEWLINSPDRLIRRDGKFKKAVEIKSPNPETAVRYIRKGEIPKEYFPQVLDYFLVNEDLEELDFVVYSPKINNQYRLWIKTVTREELKEELKEAEAKLLKFREKWLEALRKLNLEI